MLIQITNGLILSDRSRTGLLSGLKSYYPSTKDECEGVKFVTKVNDILDALYETIKRASFML